MKLSHLNNLSNCGCNDREVLVIYKEMQDNEVRPDLSTVLAALRACSNLRDLQTGMKMHAVVIRSAAGVNIVVDNTLVHMYAKCGNRIDALRVFDRMQRRNVVSWNLLIYDYAKSGDWHLSLQLFSRMQDEGFRPCARTYVAALKACAGCAAGEGKPRGQDLLETELLERGIAIHSQLAKNRHELDMFVATTLVHMYAKCGSMTHARQVFDKMPYCSQVTWNAMILGYVETGKGDFALQFFTHMQDEGITPDALAYIAALKACGSCVKEVVKQWKGKLWETHNLEKVLSIHSQLSKHGYEIDTFVGDTLVDIYAKSGSMLHAHLVFGGMVQHSLITWNTMIFGHVENHEGELALHLFYRMQDEDFLPDARTYVAALKACARSAVKESSKQLNVEFLEKGIAIHSQLAKTDHELDIFVANALLDMYAKCSRMESAHRIVNRMLHHSTITWNSLIFGYADSGEAELALHLFKCMQDEGFTPDALTYLAILKACAGSAEKEEAKQVGGKFVKIDSLNKAIAAHSQTAKSGHDVDIFLANTLLGAYAKCGSMVHARLVFDNLLNVSVVTWNTMIFGYAENGEGELALQLFQCMQDKCFKPVVLTYVAALKACVSCAEKESKQIGSSHIVKISCLEKGLSIQSQLSKFGHELDTSITNSLLDMYITCGSMAHAHLIFNKKLHPSLVSWNSMIFAYAEKGEGDFALQLFAIMQDEKVTPDERTYIAALKACGICKGKQGDVQQVIIGYLEMAISICSQIVNSGHQLNIFVASTLVDTYAKCGSMVLARQVFDRMLYHDVISWNAIIFGYVDGGEDVLALQLFSCMQGEGFIPDARTYVAALKSCGGCAAKEESKQVEGNLMKIECLEKALTIQSQLAKTSHEFNIFVGSTLVDVYAKCGNMVLAWQEFDKMIYHSVLTWNAMIFGYTEIGDGKLALQLFTYMQDEGYMPDFLTYVAALKACICCVEIKGRKSGRTEFLGKAKAIHSQIVKSGHQWDLVVANTLMDLYIACGSMEFVRVIFDRMLHHSMMAWNTIIFGYLGSGQHELALQLFKHIQDNGLTPEALTYVAVLKACIACTSEEEGKHMDGKYVKIDCLEKGIAIHSRLAKHGHEVDIFVANSLVDMYAKCGSMVHALGVFDRMLHHSVATWNSIILGYVEIGEGQLALQLFGSMQDQNLAPNARTHVAALRACVCCAAKEEGKQVGKRFMKIECLEKGIASHSQLAKSGYELDIFVANTLIDMYAKCGSMMHAHQLFERMPDWSVVSWNSMIFGSVENGDGELALKLFAYMQDAGFVPVVLTYVAALKACSTIGALEIGKKIHVQICTAGLQNDAVIASSLVAFYGKCGSMSHAEHVFGSLGTKDLVTWNALLAGYTLLGDIRHVLKTFKSMQEECYRADSITFLSIFTAFSHVGHVGKGREYFGVMCLHHMLIPSIEHYACMIDLLGRGNVVNDALELAKHMPFEADLTIWKTILGACGKWKNIVVGKLAFESIIKLDEQDASVYALMANIYAQEGG